jgi:hypothetical protein
MDSRWTAADGQQIAAVVESSTEAIVRIGSNTWTLPIPIPPKRRARGMFEWGKRVERTVLMQWSAQSRHLVRLERRFNAMSRADRSNDEARTGYLLPSPARAIAILVWIFEVVSPTLLAEAAHPVAPAVFHWACQRHVPVRAMAWVFGCGRRGGKQTDEN